MKKRPPRRRAPKAPFVVERRALPPCRTRATVPPKSKKAKRMALDFHRPLEGAPRRKGGSWDFRQFDDGKPETDGE